ncbi:peroxisomal membrane anchor protein conserved region-domain-containing protein [Xylariaceae sp. FL0804]|nr:peroxisomal membrane anchor protein conserved region-domain-containing protein [Xylariaceae sp. FL0804]
MSDQQKGSIPAWQQQSQTGSAAAGETSSATLAQARKFLDDETVRSASVEKKRDFLKSKGLDESQVQKLLSGVEEDAEAAPERESRESTPSAESKPADAEHKSANSSPTQETAPSTPKATDPTRSDAPPIVTYPEFLTKPARPPPLLTPSRLANILTAAGSVWALFYGVARFGVGPMVDTQADARADYYAHVNKHLGDLVTKLEGAVSEVPYQHGRPLPPRSHRVDDDDSNDEEAVSVASDPTELFHRDVGTQTSPRAAPATMATSSSSPSSSAAIEAPAAEKPVDRQARRLVAIRASLRELALERAQRADGAADLVAAVRAVRDEADKLGSAAVDSGYGGVMHGGGSSGSFVWGAAPEPADDEFTHAKNAIRSVKGALLSSRSFPAVATATPAR